MKTGLAMKGLLDFVGTKTMKQNSLFHWELELRQRARVDGCLLFILTPKVAFYSPIPTSESGSTHSFT